APPAEPRPTLPASAGTQPASTQAPAAQAPAAPAAQAPAAPAAQAPAAPAAQAPAAPAAQAPAAPAAQAPAGSAPEGGGIPALSLGLGASPALPVQPSPLSQQPVRPEDVFGVRAPAGAQAARAASARSPSGV